ncbi:hypothetical protein [Limnobacter sp.]|uniref:hypothetical protein n=1 Tax=Limnobacter sp. TaxID=2003368 RepID=UPI0035112058
MNRELLIKQLKESFQSRVFFKFSDAELNELASPHIIKVLEELANSKDFSARDKKRILNLHEKLKMRLNSTSGVAGPASRTSTQYGAKSGVLDAGGFVRKVRG